MPVEASTDIGGDTEVMPNIRKVIVYSGLSFHEVMQLPCDLFQLMLKNAILDELNTTEKGREYLKTCARLAMTEIDYDGVMSLRKEV